MGMDYITDVKYFEFLPKSVDALKLLTENGYDIYIISNQSGVGKGIYTHERLAEITDYFLKELKGYGVQVRAVKYCTHRREEGCNCRKPNTAFLEQIYKDYSRIDKEELFFIGDQGRDVETAYNFGIKSILLLSGKTKFGDLKGINPKPHYVAYDLYDAVKNIVLKDDR